MDNIYPIDTNSLFEIFSFIFGATIGSFLNVCIYRIPQGKSIIRPGSHCPNCNVSIKPRHNIPIISFFYLKGRCSHCNSKISMQYPLVELLTGLLTFFLFVKFRISIEFVFYSILFTSLVVVAFIDLKYMIIPNIISLPGIIVGLLFNMLRTEWSGSINIFSDLNLYNLLGTIVNINILNSIAGTLIGGGLLLSVAYIYRTIRRAEGLGMGDVKLIAMLGAFLGVGGVVFTIFISSVIGTIVGISIILYKKGDMKYQIPYGPFLSLAAVIYVLVGGFY